MILSMTGFGQATSQYKDKKIQVEIKSLNGKTSDVRCRIPNSYKEKEVYLRKQVLSKAFRGKFDFTLIIESDKGGDEYGLNKVLFKKYYEELSSLQRELGIEQGDILQTIMRIPNVVGAINEDVDQDEWEVVASTVDQAIVALNEFRAQEGIVTEKDLQDASDTIADLLNQVTPYEESRIETIKERFRKNLEEFKSDEKIDSNRFEQEIIYYLEKLDINEEKVRLSQHCKFFSEVLQ
ncbi:MAG: YicC/YloC family endoribonuclease, partial [Saprospiraceae bacterium]